MKLKSKKPKKESKGNSWKRNFKLEDTIKKNLCAIIDEAYKDDSLENRRKYKNFSIYIFPDKTCTSVGGTYYPDKKVVRIYNFDEGPLAITGTTLHELSHHIDCMQHGKSGHGKPFYGIYKRLMYTAFDMGQVSPKKLREYTLESIYREKNKVLAIIDEYLAMHE